MTRGLVLVTLFISLFIQTRATVGFECSYQNGVSSEEACDLASQKYSENQKTCSCQTCSSCNSGYYLKDGLCEMNKCVCPNGSATVRWACPENGDHKCFRCDRGYHLETNSLGKDVCIKNSCYCKNGTPGIHCSKNYGEFCDSCDLANFHVQIHPFSSQCEQNECFCYNGVLDDDPQTCLIHNSQNCLSCDDGFTLDNKTCIRTKLPQNVCNCNFGSVNNTACFVNNSTQCGICNSGYHKVSQLNQTFCNVNVCNCENGIPNKGSNCTEHESESCSSCDTGYHLELDTLTQNYKCVENSCFCENGITNTCLHHNTTDCVDCDSGYRLYNKRCLKNVCKCDNGVAHDPCVFVSAAYNQITHCSSCDTNYHLATGVNSNTAQSQATTQICEANVCFCNNGVYDSSKNCLTHQTAICSSCNKGFHLKMNQQTQNYFCAPNTCFCNNGTHSVENWSKPGSFSIFFYFSKKYFSRRFSKK